MHPLIYAFEEYLLDSNRRELRRGSDVVSIDPQVFDILELFVRAYPSIVTKDELIANIWSGRIVSDSAISSRISSARAAIGDSGKKQRFIQTFSRKGFRFVGPVRKVQESAETPTRLCEKFAQSTTAARPYKPSLGVFSFNSIPESDRKQREFLYGIVEDLTTELSQFHWLSVVAHNKHINSKGWTVEPSDDRARESRGFYALEGSARRGENCLRLTVRLIERATGACLWAKRFDLKSNYSLEQRDHITIEIVGSIVSKLEHIEIAQARRCPPESLSAMQCYLRGLGRLYQWSRVGIDNALSMFSKAIQLDDEFASAYGMAAYCYVQRKSYGWIGNLQEESAECSRLARSAAALAADDAVAMSQAAHAIASVGGDLDSGAIFVEEALRSNPNLSLAWYVNGWIRLFLGKPGEAAGHLERAIYLNPTDPLIFKTRAALGYAYFLAGRYDDATRTTLGALSARPNYLTAMRGAAASHALAGRLEDARRLITQVHDRDPALRISNLSDLLPFSRAQDLDRWMSALQKAGLPD